MKKTPQSLLCFSVAAVVLLISAAPAYANCDLLSQTVFHAAGGRLVDCTEPAAAFIYLISDPVGTQSLWQAGSTGGMPGTPMVTLCNASAANGGDTDAGGTCQDQAGTDADGFVTIQFDWGSGSSAEGCPNPSGAGDGTTPIGIDVVDADGKVATLSVGFTTVTGGFVIEAAHQNSTPGSGDTVVDIACSDVGSLSLNSITDPDPAIRLVNVDVALPGRATGVWCDCEADAIGSTSAIFETCGGRSCGTERGTIYEKVGPCADVNDLEFRKLSNGWTVSPEQPDGTGNATVNVNPKDADGSCLIGPNFCLSPPSAVGAACTADADCNRDACQYLTASNLLGPVVAGTCDPPHCTITDIGPCTEFAPGFVRCAGDLNVACTLPAGTECISGACDIGGASCTLDSECDGVCLTGNTGASCTTDGDCSSSPEGAVGSGPLLAIGGPAAASDRAVARLAELGRNVLMVEFTVSLEENARSFDILAGGAVLNDSPILAENRGTYVASIDKAGGKLKGAKEITVRTNLDGGGTLMSEPLAIEKGNR